MKRELTKRVISFLTTLTIIATFNSAFALDAPVLATTTSGFDVSLSWTSVLGATSYTLHYAPNPYTGPGSIGTVDMGASSSFSATLWDGASYYVAVTASNGAVFGESGYSNVGLLEISSQSGPSLIGGAWLEYRPIDQGPNSGDLDSCYEFYQDGTVYWHFVHTEGRPFEGVISYTLDGNTLTFSLNHVTVTFTDTSDPNNYSAEMVWSDGDSSIRTWVRTDSCDQWR